MGILKKTLISEKARTMTKPVPDKAEVALEFPDNAEHREALREAAEALYLALAPDDIRGDGGASDLTPDEEVRLLHVME
jgi:hypothetical protein